MSMYPDYYNKLTLKPLGIQFNRNHKLFPQLEQLDHSYVATVAATTITCNYSHQHHPESAQMPLEC